MLISSGCAGLVERNTSAVRGGRVVVVVLVVVDGSEDESTTGTKVAGGCWSRIGRSSGASGNSADVATVIAGDAETPSAMGASVTSLRTLPTAAAAIEIATIVATDHASHS